MLNPLHHIGYTQILHFFYSQNWLLKQLLYNVDLTSLMLQYPRWQPGTGGPGRTNGLDFLQISLMLWD